MAPKQISLPNTVYSLDNQGILYCRFTKKDFDCELGLGEAEKHVAAIVELCECTPRPFLIDRTDTAGVLSMEAGKLFASHPKITALRLAEAYVVNSLATRLLVRFYMRMYNTKCPSELFVSLDSAIKYCSHFTGGMNKQVNV